MFCPRCGSQQGDSANFCSNCGHALGTRAGQERPALSGPPVYEFHTVDVKPYYTAGRWNEANVKAKDLDDVRNSMSDSGWEFVGQILTEGRVSNGAILTFRRVRGSSMQLPPVASVVNVKAPAKPIGGGGCHLVLVSAVSMPVAIYLCARWLGQ